MLDTTAVICILIYHGFSSHFNGDNVISKYNYTGSHCIMSVKYIRGISCHEYTGKCSVHWGEGGGGVQ